jgi:hypothetical protein
MIGFFPIEHLGGQAEDAEDTEDAESFPSSSLPRIASAAEHRAQVLVERHHVWVRSTRIAWGP